MQLLTLYAAGHVLHSCYALQRTQLVTFYAAGYALCSWSRLMLLVTLYAADLALRS